MGIGAYIYGFEVCDYHTETAATPIDEAIQAQDSKRLALISLAYLCGSTAHTISFMYAKDAAAYAGSARNTTSAAAAAAQAVIDVSTTPRDPAGNAAAASDIVAYQCTDDTWEFNTIASVSTKAITHNTNLAKAVASGAKYLIFGVVGDGACLKIKVTASVENKYGAAAGGSGIVLAHPYIGEPFYVSIDNGTTAGYLNSALFAHIDK
jgi:hypothetical protein